MSKKKRKRPSVADDEDVIGVADDGEVAAADSDQSDDDDIAADSMIKVTFPVCLAPGSRCNFALWSKRWLLLIYFYCNLAISVCLMPAICLRFVTCG